MLSNYVFGAHAVLLCYDITNFDSFQNLEDWYRVVRRTFEMAPKMPYCALLANKCDLKWHRKVEKTKYHRSGIWKQRHDMGYLGLRRCQ